MVHLCLYRMALSAAATYASLCAPPPAPGWWHMHLKEHWSIKSGQVRRTSSSSSGGGTCTWSRSPELADVCMEVIWASALLSSC